jgi:hypothetical protein
MLPTAVLAPWHEDVLIVATCFVCLFLFAWVYFYRYIFRDIEVRDPTPQLLFSVVFTLSSSMFLLVIAEIFPVISYPCRLMVWQFDLYVLLVLVIVVLPLYISFSFVHRMVGQNWNVSWRCHTLCATCVFFAWLYLFWMIGSSFPILSASPDSGMLLLENCVARVGVIGVTIISILSGFGAVNYPFTTMTIFLRSFDMTALHKLERTQLQLLERIGKKKQRALLSLHRAELEAEILVLEKVRPRRGCVAGQWQ